MPLDPDVLVERHTVRTSEVTPVRNRNPEVAHGPFQEIYRGHGCIIADSAGLSWMPRRPGEFPKSK